MYVQVRLKVSTLEFKLKAEGNRKTTEWMNDKDFAKVANDLWLASLICFSTAFN